MSTAGFYTSDLRYAPNSVYGPGYTLLIADKDIYTYPVNGWTYFASRAEAVEASLAANGSDPQAIEQQRLALVIQDVLDAEARLRGFDNIFTAVTYVDDPNTRFAEDGALLKAWRSAVWTKSYEILAQVIAGTIAKPSDAALIAMLPSIDSITVSDRRR